MVRKQNLKEIKMEQITGLSIPFEKSGEDAVPIYHQLSRAIQEQIEKGRLAVGEQIPTERKIAELNNVSMATVRKALDKLVQRGLINRVQGKGTYVSSTAIRRQKIRYYPFVKDFHGDASNTKVKLIELKIVKGQPWINRHLKIEAIQDLYEMKRTLNSHSKPLVYCVSYLPRDMFKNLKDYKKYLFEKHYLYMLLENEFGVSTIENVELYGVELADEDTAKFLRIEVGHPLLRVEMIALTHKKKPYEYRISHCLTDERKIRRVI